MATMNINWKPGQSIIYAGTPIDEDGNIANNSNAVALVVSDTLNPNAAEVITDGTWDEETNYHGITISDDCKRALPGVEFVGSDGELHPATSLPTPKSDDSGKSAVVNEQGNAYALGAGGGAGLSLVSGGGINITWDGSTEGRDSFDLAIEGESVTFYKVADGFLSADDMVGCNLTLNNSMELEVEGYMVMPVVADKVITIQAVLWSCKTGTYNTVYGDIIVPSDGVYFALDFQTEGQSITPTSLTKSAPSKLMQNGEDVTQNVKETVGGTLVVNAVIADDDSSATVDKSFGEIASAFSEGRNVVIYARYETDENMVFPAKIISADSSAFSFQNYFLQPDGSGSIEGLEVRNFYITTYRVEYSYGWKSLT